MDDTLLIHLDGALLDALDDLATRTDTSRDRLAEEAIADYVALATWKMHKIERGLAAADAGDFADESEIEALRAKFTGRA